MSIWMLILWMLEFGRATVSAKETTANELIGVCAGTSDGLQAQPAKYRYEFLRSRYTNCTYINGNLEISYLDDEKLTYDLSFLETIREVTGYVLIAFVYTDYVPLINLEIIRGNTLFTGRAGEEKVYSLYIASNVLPQSRTIGLKELRFRSLREILRGYVYIGGNQVLCHGQDLNWRDIMPNPNVTYAIDNDLYTRKCSPCHSKCHKYKKNKRGLCWGSGPEYCQTLFREPCSAQCDGRCFGNHSSECCHSQCAAGCTGPTNRECRACRSFYDDGQCVPFCPPLEIYEPSEYRNVPNKNAKYTYGSICVSECPEHLLQDGSACVKTCPPGKLPRNKKCVPCNGPCPKRCPGLDSDFIDLNNIEKFRNCTIIDGNLRILKSTFERDPYRELPPLDIKYLNYLSTVKEITGYLTIQYSPPELEDLSFLSGLETIYGRNTLAGSHVSFSVLFSNMKSLKLPSLKNIKSNGVMIYNNPDLCFYDTVDWSKIIQDTRAVGADNFAKFVYLRDNKDQTQCRREGHVCDSRCDGCWGPGNHQCQSCKSYTFRNATFDNLCIDSCSSLPMIYDAGVNMTCKECHPQCASGCTGPGENQCSGGCKNFRDGPFCVEQCPEAKYNDSSNVCQECHKSCVGGCTGEYNHLGRGGCNNCSFAMMSVDGAFVDHCLVEEVPGVYECPQGHYLQPPPKPGKDMAKCFKCDRRCQVCHGSGPFCPKCTYVKHGDRCFDTCPSQTYAADVKGEKICFPCHSECKRGCNGSLSTDCKFCVNVKILLEYQEGDKVKKIQNCSAECPADLPHLEYYPETGEDICVAQIKSGRTNTIVGISVGVAVVLIIAVIITFCCCHRRYQAKQNMLKIMMNGYDETMPVTPTDIKPDLAKLRLIKESELRRGGIIGSGAFGTVYKGVWVPENENVKIAVAVKILQESSSSNENKELLEEARVMASVENPYCIRILCFCMTAQMMLVTQLMPLGCLLDYVRKNKDNIGSKVLLNWCTQIAKGMAYLEDRGIVHRDLAARNVLMQSTTHLKITDFGLAKLLDNEDEFKAVGGKMPIKWLALECIQERVFTHKSDVWSYGVTVWEMFSYGQRPYEIVRAREVPDLLAKGERLPQPSICTIDVYMLMIKCWMLDAKSRPSFRELADAFEKMARDPGRYLVIEGDALMRLPSQTVDPQDLLRSISVAVDGPEVLVDAEEYLQPRSTTTDATEGEGATGIDKDLRNSMNTSRYDDSRSLGNSPAHENQLLLNPSREKKYGHLEDAYEARRVRKGNSIMGRYSSDPCRSNRGHQYVNDEVDGFTYPDDEKMTAFVDLPVDDDDYLQPTIQHPHYIDVIDSDYHSMTMRPSMDESPPPSRSMDNPEYFRQNADKRSISPSDSETLRSVTNSNNGEHTERSHGSPNTMGSVSSCSDYSRSLSNSSDPFGSNPSTKQTISDPFVTRQPECNHKAMNGEPYRYSPSDLYPRSPRGSSSEYPPRSRGGSTSEYPPSHSRGGSTSSQREYPHPRSRGGSSSEYPHPRSRTGSSSDYPGPARDYNPRGYNTVDYPRNNPHTCNHIDPNNRRSGSTSSDPFRANPLNGNGNYSNHHHHGNNKNGTITPDTALKPCRHDNNAETAPLRPPNGYNRTGHDYYNDIHYGKQNGHVPRFYGYESTV